MSVATKVLVTVVAAVASVTSRLPAQLQGVNIWRITDTSRVVDLSIASSGGVSIGAYLAGANWMLAELFKFLQDHPEQRARFLLPSYRIGAMSGASAGNVNSLLTALRACDAGPARPAEASALWDIWMQVGIEQLLPAHNSDPSLELGLFDRGYLNTALFDRLKSEFARSPTPGCFIPIVATLSKLVPARLPLNQLMAAQVQRFVASYSLATEQGGNGNGMRFVLRPAESLIALDTALGKQLSLVSSEEAVDAIDLDDVYQLLKASSSVAYLFEPVELSYCDAAKAALVGGCVAQEPFNAVVQRARFVDGGAIDNSPLFAAMRLMELRDSLHAAGQARRRDRGTLLISYEARRQRLGGSPNLAFTPAPSGPNGTCGTGPGQERCGGIGALTQFLGGLLASGGQFELQWLARLRARDPSLRALDVDVTTRQSAIAGEHLMNSSAFLARPLREFDFQVGIYDVLHFAARALLCLPEHQPFNSSGTDRCVIDTVRGLVDRFPLSCQSSLAVDLLLRQEYGIESTEALRELQLRSTSHCDESSIESRERALAYRSLFSAIKSVADGEARPCGPSGPVVGAMCAEGTLRVLRALGEDQWFRDYVAREADRCDRAVTAAPDTLRLRVSAQCFANRAFARMLNEPERAFFTLVRTLLDRAQWLEEEVERRQDGPRSMMGWDVVTQYVNLAARSALLAEETGLVMFPTAVPMRRNAWRMFTGYVVPQEIGLEALGNGWSYFWHPVQYRWKSGLTVGASGGVLENGFEIAPDSLHPGGKKSRLAASLRAGFRPLQRGNVLVSGITAGVRYIHPSPADTDTDGVPLHRLLVPELRFDLLWDRFAITLSRNPGYGAPGEQHRLRATVSVMDVGGIAYWAMRTGALR